MALGWLAVLTLRYFAQGGEGLCWQQPQQLHHLSGKVSISTLAFFPLLEEEAGLFLQSTSASLHQEALAGLASGFLLTMQLIN